MQFSVFSDIHRSLFALPMTPGKGKGIEWWSSTALGAVCLGRVPALTPFPLEAIPFRDLEVLVLL